MPEPGDILTHAEMCQAEGGKYLQKGMNFRKSRPSIFLMSRRPNAPYQDEIRDEGRVLIYEGHDIRPAPDAPDPKSVDQPIYHPDGKPTDNGKFYEAARTTNEGGARHLVHVYEKIKTNIWVFNGEFELLDAWVESDGTRKVCKFQLRLVETEEERREIVGHPDHTRIVPSAVKAEVWRRDQGKCVKCGATDHLHFDHIIPFSKGGASILPANIQVLCARHNLRKSDRIQ